MAKEWKEVTAMAYEGVRECAVCAWRENCRLKWRSEPGGALTCPEYSYDLRLSQQKPRTDESPPPTGEQGAGD